MTLIVVKMPINSVFDSAEFIKLSESETTLTNRVYCKYVALPMLRLRNQNGPGNDMLEFHGGFVPASGYESGLQEQPYYTCPLPAKQDNTTRGENHWPLIL